MTLASTIHDLLGQGVVESVSIGDEADKATWRVKFKPVATDAEKATVTARLAAFDLATYTANEVTVAEIARLERQQTMRRIREAIRGTDGGWLMALDQRIAILRAGLR